MSGRTGAQRPHHAGGRGSASHRAYKERPGIVIRRAFLLIFCTLLPPAAATPAAAQQTSYVVSPVGMTTRAFVDSTRPSWDGSGPRPLLTTIWYPAAASAREEPVVVGPPDQGFFLAGAAAPEAEVSAAGDRLPLIVLSHGTGGAALTLMWLGQHLAANGFVVAAVNHHGNTAIEERHTAQGFMLWWERAADLSAVIDQMLVDEALGPRIDAGRIGAAGFSLGGYTVLSLAGGITDLAAYEAFCSGPSRDFTCEPQAEFLEVREEFERVRNDPQVLGSLARHGRSFRDERVRAVLALAPALGGAFTDAGLSTIRVPVQIIAGDADPVTPLPTNARRFAHAIGNAGFTVLEGVGHYTFLSECTDDGKQELPSLCVDEQVERNDVHELVKTLALAFFQESL